MYTNGRAGLVPRLELSAVPELETPPRPDMSVHIIPGDGESLFTMDEDEQHPPLPAAGQSDILAYDESESDECDYFKEAVSSDSGVSMDESDSGVSVDEEVFAYEQDNVLTNLKATRLSTGKLKATRLSRGRKLEAKEKKSHDRKKHGGKKQKKKFEPRKGVAQLPRSWSEVSKIASNKKRAKELYQLIEASEHEREHLLAGIRVEESRNKHGEHDDDDGHGGHGGHGHGHGIPDTPIYQVYWLLSTVFVFLIRFVFCIVFALLIHEAHPRFTPSVGLGIHVQLISCAITCVTTGGLSQIGASIGGPDIIVALFQAGMAIIIGESDCDDDQLLPTLLFLICITTMITALVWILIGYFKQTRIVEFFPITVQSGFLACIGWKVMYYAISLTTNTKFKLKYAYKFTKRGQTWEFWRLLVVALPLGFGLYYGKKYHKQLRLPPILILIVFLVFPAGVFYTVMAAQGATLDDFHDQGWMFPKEPENNTLTFYSQWTELVMNFDKIHMESVVKSVPYVIFAVLMVTLDVTIKIRSTKKQLERPLVDPDFEMKLAGLQNIAVGLCMGPPGYTQVKFNALNYHILHNSEDRKPGILTGVICFFLFFLELSFPILSVLPRPIIGMLLIYAGMPFVEDHLICSYFRVCKKEYFAIWAMVLTNAILGFLNNDFALMFAFVVGLVLSLFIFMLQYYRTRSIREMRDGEGYQSTVMRPYIEQKLLENLGCRLKIIVLQGFMFFISSTATLGAVKKLGKENKEKPFPQRTRYVIIDFHHVRSADYSSVEQLKDVKMVAEAFQITIIFSGLNKKMQRMFSQQQLIAPISKQKTGCAAQEEHPDYVATFQSLDYASEHVETLLLERASIMRSLWLQFDSFNKIRAQALIKASVEMFEPVIDHTTIGDKLVEIWKFAELRTLQPGDLLCRQQTHDRTLYVVQEGILTSFADLPDGTTHRLQKMSRGTFINDECLFVDLPVAYNVRAEILSYVWAFSQESIERMQIEEPWLALEIVRRALRHTVAQATVQRLEIIEHDASVSDTAEFNRTHADANKPTGTSAFGSALKRSVLSKVCWEADSHAKIHRRQSSKKMSESTSFYQEAIDTPKESKTPTVENKTPRVSRQSSVKISRVTDHHAHNFINLPSLLGQSKNKTTMRDKAIYSRAKTHLSNTARKEAENCFAFLAANATAADPKSIMGQKVARMSIMGGMGAMGGMGGMGSRDIRVPRVSVKIAAKDATSLLNTRVSPSSPRSPPLRSNRIARSNSFNSRQYMSQTIHIDQVDKAMFPLNLYPTHDELQEMHDIYAKSRNRVDLAEFITMVEHLTFADIDEATRANLYGMYKQGCDEDHRGLTREALKNLMFSMHDEHSEDEVDQIMMDWDMHGTGRVPFESFLSIIAMDLKQEEKERAFEKDFERFCPHFVRDSDIEDESQRINVKNLMDVFRDLKVPLTEEVAEEMIFDANLSKQDACVSYDDLIATITIVTSKEIYEALDSQKGVKHSEGEDKKVLYQSMLHLYDGQK